MQIARVAHQGLQCAKCGRVLRVPKEGPAAFVDEPTQSFN
jgi:hypothetical protein